MEKLVYNAPSFFKSNEDIERLMVWAYNLGASDITLTSGQRIMLDVLGQKVFPVDRPLINAEVEEMLKHMANRPDAVSFLNSQHPLDFTYKSSPSKGKIYRFRVDALAGDDSGNNGIQVTCRTIPEMPPKLETLNVEKIIFENIDFKNGLILVTGTTGSGKSTLLAAMIRYVLENPKSHKKIITFEDPIEYIYDLINAPSSQIFQTEIGRHLLSFKLGAINSVRRNSDMILIGEIRDPDILKEVISLSMSGHLILSTLHDNGFISTISRMITMFPEGDRSSRIADIIGNLRMTIGQQLLHKVGGGRIAIREIMTFSHEVKDMLLNTGTGLENIIATSKKALEKYGQSFTQDALDKYQQGLITKETFIQVAKNSQNTEESALRMTESLKIRVIGNDDVNNDDLVTGLMKEIGENNE